MTKKEMVYDILSATNEHGVSERCVNKVISKHSKERIANIYEKFISDEYHANYCWIVLFREVRV